MAGTSTTTNTAGGTGVTDYLHHCAGAIYDLRWLLVAILILTLIGLSLAATSSDGGDR